MKQEHVRNADLLISINDSKMTFCSYIDHKYTKYHFFADSVEAITQEWLDEQITHHNTVLKKRVKIGNSSEAVIRVMTQDHIPLKTAAETTKRHKSVHKRTPFPPFKHYILEDGIVKEVLRSHWIGGFDNGHFSVDHGNINRVLAKQIMLLSKKYADKGNWRGYSYNDEMVSAGILQLTAIALQFDESKSSNPFSYYTQCMKMSFTRILNNEKDQRNLRDELMMMNGANPSDTYALEHKMRKDK